MDTQTVEMLPKNISATLLRLSSKLTYEMGDKYRDKLFTTFSLVEDEMFIGLAGSKTGMDVTSSGLVTVYNSTYQAADWTQKVMQCIIRHFKEDSHGSE